LPILVFFCLAVSSGMNIGFRHLLPIYPFLFVWLGGCVGVLWASRSSLKKAGVFLLGLWLGWGALSNYPDYLAYFNEVTEPADRYKVLADSNLDWGQDLKGLKQWMDEHNIPKIHLAYFGTADPAYYGIDAIHEAGTWSTVLSKPRSDDTASVAEYIAISATHLASVYFWPAKPYHLYASTEPIAVIGGSIHVYKRNNGNLTGEWGHR
jgi:hypothetical protein